MRYKERVSSSSSRRRLRVPPDLAGQRLDKVLARLVPGQSRVRLREMVEDGRVWLDGAVVTKPSLPLEEGGRLEVELVERDRTRPGSAAGLALEVLYEDGVIAAVAKPAGMIAHPSDTVRGGTVAELAAQRWGELPAPHGPERAGLVHRLDADTSGVLLLALDADAAADLVRQFEAREVKKEYLALVHGEPRFDADWIEAPLARSRGGDGRIVVAAQGEGRPAETFYRVLERLRGYAVLACEPRTGRTHQIRVHLASIGHAIVGDALYRGRKKLALPRGAPAMGRHALHAARIELTHPRSGERVAFEAPLPADFATLLDWLRRYSSDAEPGGSSNASSTRSSS